MWYQFSEYWLHWSFRMCFFSKVLLLMGLKSKEMIDGISMDDWNGRVSLRGKPRPQRPAHVMMDLGHDLQRPSPSKETLPAKRTARVLHPCKNGWELGNVWFSFWGVGPFILKNFHTEWCRSSKNCGRSQLFSAHMSFDDSVNIVNWHAAGKVESEIDESGTNAFQLVKVLSSAQRTTLWGLGEDPRGWRVQSESHQQLAKLRWKWGKKMRTRISCTNKQQKLLKHPWYQHLPRRAN